MEQPAGAVAIVASEQDVEQLERDPARERAQMIERLDALGQSLATTRSEAINARQSSGVEDIWYEDEEFYQGIDDANRGEHPRAAWRQKPPGQSTGNTAGTSAANTRSTVFPNITGPYVDAAAARIADMLLPTDDRSWAIKETPVPELHGAAEGKYSKDMLLDAAALHPGDPRGAQSELAKATQEALRVIGEAKEKAEKAQTRIEDWLVECQWHANVRAVIEDAARLGTGILKGPVPHRKTRWLYEQQANGLTKVEEIKPATKRVDPWNFYPDPACGENIHNGGYTWERDFITRKQLRELKGQPGYIDEQIDLCIEEGARLAIGDSKQLLGEVITSDTNKDRFEIWYFHGTAEKEDLEAAGCNCEGEPDPHMPAMVTMVNNRVIRASLNPLETGEFPYDVMVWRARAGHWTGIGVGRQVRVSQRMITAATRNIMDNAGLAAGPILVFKQNVVYGSDGDDSIRPRKIFYIAEDADEMVDATKAIGSIRIDMLVDDLLKIIDLGLRFAEHTTGLPMLLQGHGGEAPDTLGGMQMLNNNASTTLRRLGRLFDDRVTEPHIRRYYHWLLQHGEDAEKGDYCIDARGSSALVERDIQNQAVSQMGQIVLDPRFGKDPKKWMDEFLKANRLDPKRFAYDDEKWQQIVENMSQQPQDPSIAVAELRAAAEEKITVLGGNIKKELLLLEQRYEDHNRERDRQLQLILSEIDGALKKGMSDDQLKAKLADSAMKIRAQLSLNAADGRREAFKPPTEPKGRAKPGQSFTH